MADEINLREVGNRITLLRREKGLTGEKLAELLGVSPQAVSKWENGRNLPETALLPALSKLLGVSIDSILMPRELVILSAVYTDGETEADVTRVIDALAAGGKLDITVSPQLTGADLGSERIPVLCVKYRAPEGVFYTFAPEGKRLTIDAAQNSGVIPGSEGEGKEQLKILGAYYGNTEKYRDVMVKINHYEYFRWNEIPVNHETFPSLPGSDSSEYLLIIYKNASGIYAVSCREGESLAYSPDRTSLSLSIKDDSSRILPGIMTLRWEAGIDCTWAGAVYAALKYMGEAYSYEQIMGVSGACFRLAFAEVWDWSATDALVAYDYSTPFFRAIGIEQLWADRAEKDERPALRRAIAEDIRKGRPPVAINLRVAPEWGVITGYAEDGKVFFCRTYFDREYLNKNEDYLESDSWPFLITRFGEKTGKPPEREILLTSLKNLVGSFEALPCRGYYQGCQAYLKWIGGLLDRKLWENCPAEDIGRRTGVNDSMLLNLIDARRCAAVYLAESAALLGEGEKAALEGIAAIYREIYTSLSDFRAGFKESGDILRYNDIETGSQFRAETRERQAEHLKEALKKEEKASAETKAVLEREGIGSNDSL